MIIAAGVAASCGTSEGSSTPTTVSTPNAASPDLPGNPPPGAPDAASKPPQIRDAEAEAPPPPWIVATTETLTIAGEPRAFMLAVPSSYDAKTTYPLVLVLHGDGGDGPSMRDAFPFDDVSGQAAVVAYPSGRRAGWNLHEPIATNSDFAFLVALVDSLRTRFSIDRVFGTGFSSGAFMVNQVACRRPSFFHAIAPHSGGAPYEPRDPSAGRWPNGYTKCHDQTMGSGSATLVIHGTSDGDVTYDSGDFTAKYWAFVNGCTGARSASTPPCVMHVGCPAERPVVLCSIQNLGHSLWGDAIKRTWAFFSTL